MGTVDLIVVFGDCQWSKVYFDSAVWFSRIEWSLEIQRNSTILS